MPLYEIECPVHGRLDVFARSSELPAVWLCPKDECGAQSKRVFHAAYASVEAMDEIRSHDRDPRTRGLNLGLPGTFKSHGKDARGKEHFEYVPRTAAEASSTRKAREIAKQHGLTMIESGPKRALPK